MKNYITMPTKAKRKVRYVCGKCGGENLGFRCDALWSVDRQEFTIEDSMSPREDSFCFDCSEMAYAKAELMDEDIYHVVYDKEHKLYLRLSDNIYKAQSPEFIRLIGTGSYDVMSVLYYAVVNERKIATKRLLDVLKAEAR